MRKIKRTLLFPLAWLFGTPFEMVNDKGEGHVGYVWRGEIWSWEVKPKSGGE